jgi:hypothetical protein
MMSALIETLGMLGILFGLAAKIDALRRTEGRQADL